VNGEVRGWLLGSTPVGRLVRFAVLLFTPIVVALWAFDQYLHSRATQGQPAGAAASGSWIALRVDVLRPLTVLVVLLALIVTVALIRRLAPKRIQRRLYRGLQVAGGLLALLQPGLLLGAAITAVICRERPKPLRFLVRGCAAAPATLLLALGAWSWGWPILLKTSHVAVVQAITAALVEIFLGSFWLRLYVDLTSTAEAKVKVANQNERLEQRFKHAAGPDPIHPPFWQRRRRHPAGYVDPGFGLRTANAMRRSGA
jgi:hypothetical protein